MVKAAKPKVVKKVAKVAKAKPSTSQSSSSSSSSTVPDLNVSPPLQRNGTKASGGSFILTNEEQALYRKFSTEIKQVSGLVILKCGLGIAEGPCISQILQEDTFLKNFAKVHEALTKDPIIGKRVAAVPVKFLNIGTSKAKEVMTGPNLRKKYSQMKSYINNTLSVIWRK